MTTMRCDHARDDGEVVADEQQGHAALRDEPVEQASTPSCTVTSSAVVGSSAISSARARGQGDRDRDALALPAGELVAGRRARCARSGSATSASAAATAARSAAPRRPQVAPQRLGDLAADPHQRVERGERLLEHDLRDRAAQRAQRRIGAPTTSCAVEPDRSGRRRARRAAGPATASEVSDLPEPDSPMRPRRSPASSEKDTSRTSGRRAGARRESPDDLEEAHRALRLVGSASSRRPSARRFTPRTRATMRDAGGDRADRRGEHGALRLLQHPSPRGVGRRRAEPEVGQARLGEHGDAELQREVTARVGAMFGRTCRPTMPGSAGAATCARR